MKLPLFALGLCLTVPTLAHAQVPPGVNPGVANQAAQRAQQSDVAYWYSLLPAQIFGAFGDVDRLELLQSKGAIYDRNRGFIEVFAPGDPNQNDVEKLQVKLYQTGKGLMVGVSQIVWNQPNVKGAVGFFALGQDGQLFDVTRQVFPFQLQAPATDDKKAAPPVNAFLPRQGTTIETGVPETEIVGDSYAFDGDTFRIEAKPER